MMMIAVKMLVEVTKVILIMMIEMATIAMNTRVSSRHGMCSCRHVRSASMDELQCAEYMRKQA